VKDVGVYYVGLMLRFLCMQWVSLVILWCKL